MIDSYFVRIKSYCSNALHCEAWSRFLGYMGSKISIISSVLGGLE
jgi:hypothetical protein